MEEEIKERQRENERSNWDSKRLGLGSEMRNSNSGLHLMLFCSVKFRTQLMRVAYATMSRELHGCCSVAYAAPLATSLATFRAASSVLAPRHESFASNAFLSLSQALFNL
ncbi:hypothetical protein PIB30_091583 [Stylosanthes scabra]|uniref:Uncharacterized protein n=1 Tax=Stylosanthes scabra TaxID=79078 RepID=A0ABU6UTD6_9FABA|nr:hypothetical protein [Stylosanthes scabra]